MAFLCGFLINLMILFCSCRLVWMVWQPQWHLLPLPGKYLCGFWPQVFSGLFLSHSLQSFDQWDLNRYWKFMKCSWVSDLSSSAMWRFVCFRCSIYPAHCMYLFACFHLQRILLSSRFVLHQDQDDLICTNADSKTGEKEAIRNITK